MFDENFGMIIIRLTVYQDISAIINRRNGATVYYPDGTKKCYLSGQLHNLDGPAIEMANGDKMWYKYNRLISAIMNGDTFRYDKKSRLRSIMRADGRIERYKYNPTTKKYCTLRENLKV
jgi:YD repeat-containing protein